MKSKDLQNVVLSKYQNSDSPTERARADKAIFSPPIKSIFFHRIVIIGHP